MGSHPRLNLLPYQERWIEDDSRFKIGMWARQTGKTFSTTLEIVRDIYRGLRDGRRVNWLILSAGERQAKEALEQVKRHCKSINLLFTAGESDDRDGAVVYKVLEVNFENGSRVMAVPANPNTVRGFSSNLFFDEVAFWLQSEEIWRAAVPIATRGGFKVRVTSTPNGKRGVFYRLWSNEDPTWGRHRVTIQEAVAQGLALDLSELERAIGDPYSWRQEYCLEFLEESTAWLSYDLIVACEHDLAGDVGDYKGGKTYLGWDIARRRDLSVLWLAEVIGDVLWAREIVACKGSSFEEQWGVFCRLMDRYRVSRACLDQSGMGEPIVEQARRRYGSRVEGVLFTGNSKQDLATVGKCKFEDRRVRIPVDSQIREAHHAVKRVITSAGNVRFDADRDETGHADHFWAHMLAIHAWDGGGSPIEWRGTGSRRFNRSRFADWQEALA